MSFKITKALLLLSDWWMIYLLSVLDKCVLIFLDDILVYSNTTKMMES
jgi:hypothetical protein